MSSFSWYKGRGRTCSLITHIRKLTEAGDHNGALAAALELERWVRSDGIASATVAWVIAIAFDHAGRLPEALDYILKAVRADALSPSVDHSLGIVLEKVRSRIVGNHSWDESDLAMYSRLAEEGLADDDMRLGYGGYLMVQGRYREALQVALAVANFCPCDPDAWDLVEAAAIEVKDFLIATNAKQAAQAARTPKDEPKANMTLAQA